MGNIIVKFQGGSFSVFNRFVDEFIKEANPSYIKVYLYLMRHISAGNKISLSRMSNDTGLIKSDIISAFIYWDKLGVVSYNDDPENPVVHILNLDMSTTKNDISKDISYEIHEDYRQEEKKLFQPNESVSSSYKANVVVKAIHDDEKLAHLFSIIQQMLNKNLSSNDYKIIYSFIDYLKLPEQVVIILFEYCISINKINMRYIEKIAYSWADSGINTIEAAESFVREKTEQQTIEAYYKHKFKISGRDFTETEIKLLRTWINEYKANEDTIIAAFEKTVMNTGKVSFKYMDTIIKSECRSDKTIAVSSKFKNYPAKYEISDQEKIRLEKMMSEYEGGGNS